MRSSLSPTSVAREFPRNLLAFSAALAVVLAELSVASAIPLTSGSAANDVVGQEDFNTGIEDFDTVQFFGAAFPSAKRMFVPSDVVLDETNDRLFVADLHNHRILIFDVGGDLDDDISASFVLGQPDFVTGGADPADPYGNTNTANALYGCSAGVNACGLHRAWAVAYDPTNQILFGADPDNHRVMVWDLSLGITNGMPATYVLGQQDFVSSSTNTPCSGGSAGVNACGLKDPSDLHYDQGSETLFVSDSGNNRVLAFDLSGGALATGIAASVAIGQPDLVSGSWGRACGGGSNNVVDACSIRRPEGVVYDSSNGRLLVGDAGNSRVLVLTGTLTSGMAASSVLGQPDFTTATTNTDCGGGGSGDTNTNACGLGLFSLKIDIDPNDEQILVSDGSNHRVLVFDSAAISNGEAAIAAVGQPNFTSCYDPNDGAYGGSTSRTRFAFPQGVAFDTAGDRAFFADAGNHRILVYSLHAGSEPVDVEGQVTDVTATENPDGSTTIDITGDDGGAISITLPDGSDGLGGAEEIVITYENPGSPNEPRVKVDADLPPGETKSITFPRGIANHVCIYDHAGADFIATSQCSQANKYQLPQSGNCETHSVPGDPGDNPDDPDDEDGMHPVEICLNADGDAITLNGLRHTVVAALAPDGDFNDGRIGGADRDDDGVRTGVAGCSTVPSKTPLVVAIAGLLVLALARRRLGARAVRARRPRRTRR